MKTVIYLVILSVVIGCASSPRNKWTDPVGRILIDPDSISAEHYVLIQRALVDSGKWFVVDRSKGYKAIKAEQERLHRDESDRFDDREKFSRWGKLFGVGGVIVASAQCKKEQGWLIGRWYNHCRQFLSLIDTNTGEVIAAVENEAESKEAEFYPPWDDAVAKLNSAYPKSFEFKTTKRMEDYKDLVEEESVRQKERLPSNGE